MQRVKRMAARVGEGMDLEILFIAGMMLTILLFAAAWGIELERQQEVNRRNERFRQRAIRRAK